MDQRDYGIGAQILRHLGVHKMRLMTNNPRKVAALQAHGIIVEERVPLMTGRNPHNEQYLDTKRGKLGHMFDKE